MAKEKKLEQKDTELKLVATTDITLSEIRLKFSDGHFEALTVRKGELLRLDLADPSDVQKSLAMGQLRNCVESGWLVEEKKLKKAEPAPETAPEFLKPVATIIPASQTLLEQSHESNDFPVDAQGGIKSVDFQDAAFDPKGAGPAIAQQDVNLNIHEVKTWEQFQKLPYNYKLQCVKVTPHKDLLEAVVKNTDSKQIKANASMGLDSLNRQEVAA